MRPSRIRLFFCLTYQPFEQLLDYLDCRGDFPNVTLFLT
jgi:hypothetical protein